MLKGAKNDTRRMCEGAWHLLKWIKQGLLCNDRVMEETPVSHVCECLGQSLVPATLTTRWHPDHMQHNGDEFTVNEVPEIDPETKLDWLWPSNPDPLTHQAS